MPHQRSDSPGGEEGGDWFAVDEDDAPWATPAVGGPAAAMTASDPDEDQIPAGWYADPSTPGFYRFWDGTQGTDHVRPIAAPASGAARTPAGTGPTAEGNIPAGGAAHAGRGTTAGTSSSGPSLPRSPLPAPPGLRGPRPVLRRGRFVAGVAVLAGVGVLVGGAPWRGTGTALGPVITSSPAHASTAPGEASGPSTSSTPRPSTGTVTSGPRPVSSKPASLPTRSSSDALWQSDDGLSAHPIRVHYPSGWSAEELDVAPTSGVLLLPHAGLVQSYSLLVSPQAGSDLAGVVQVLAGPLASDPSVAGLTRTPAATPVGPGTLLEYTAQRGGARLQIVSAVILLRGHSVVVTGSAVETSSAAPAELHARLRTAVNTFLMRVSAADR